MSLCVDIYLKFVWHFHSFIYMYKIGKSHPQDFGFKFWSGYEYEKSSQYMILPGEIDSDITLIYGIPESDKFLPVQKTEKTLVLVRQR